MINTPIGARVFVRQTKVCVTKTHLANVKMGVYPLSEHLHPLSAGIQMGFECYARKASEFPPYFYILSVLLEMLSEYSLYIARDCRPSFAYSANDEVQAPERFFRYIDRLAMADALGQEVLLLKLGESLLFFEPSLA